MAEKTNIKKCKQLVSNLKKKVYFKSALAAYNKKYNQIVQKLVANGEQLESANKKAYRLVLSQLHDIMRETQPLIEDVINIRIENGEISDASQARKSVAGNLFQQFVAYTLAQNILVQNINKDVIVSLSSNVLDEYAVIDVGEDKQNLTLMCWFTRNQIILQLLIFLAKHRVVKGQDRHINGNC